MADQREGTSGRSGARYDRHDEAFWRDLLAQWGNCGGSIRAFCRQHGLAVSTFGLWRKRLSHTQQSPVAPPMSLTAETAFIAAATVAAPTVVPASDPLPSKSRDQVVVHAQRRAYRAERGACRTHRALRAGAVGRRPVLIGGDVQAFICRDAVDMRKSIDGLSYLVEPLLAKSPLSGHLFVFVGRERRRR